MLFKDNNENYMPQLEILPVNGAKFPSFLKFNPTNRTIFGKANETGSFVVDSYPISLRWKDFIVVGITVFLIGLLASLPAALRAMRISTHEKIM
jgi:ABC-type lipoprotein release transport system permease subunit